MKMHSESRVWTIEVIFEEDESETEAKAVLRVADQELGGWGRARRNPSDPDRPRVGEELAAARALSELVPQACRGRGGRDREVRRAARPAARLTSESLAHAATF